MSFTVNTIDMWPSHTHSITTPCYATEFALSDPIKEPEMTVAEKIAKERREARERQEAEQRYNDIAQVIDMIPVGDVLTWSEGERACAAIRDDDGWRITGRTGVLDVEALIAHLIDHDADTIGNR